MAKGKQKQPLTKEWFVLREAAKLSNLTPAMVDYLCRSGVLVPRGKRNPGHGRPRRYLFGDVVMLRALAKLLECGISVRKLKTALQRLRKAQIASITESNLPGQFLVTDGSTIYFKSKEQMVEDLLAGGQLAFNFVIELTEVRDAVTKEMTTLGYTVRVTA